MVRGMELRHFLEKLEVSGSFFVSLCFFKHALRQKGNVR